MALQEAPDIPMPQALLFDVANSSFTFPVFSLQVEMPDHDAASEVYAKLLLLEGLGYPLWYPDLDQNLPQAYLDGGVNIGDVGYITGDGAFAFQFNVCADSMDAINVRGVPTNFAPWSVRSQDKAHYPAMRPPETVIKRGSVNQKNLQVHGMAQPS
jgi:hypothetical protein